MFGLIAADPDRHDRDSACAHHRLPWLYEPAADRHLRRRCRCSRCFCWSCMATSLPHRTRRALPVHGVRGRKPQRHAGRADRPLRRGLARRAGVFPIGSRCAERVRGSLSLVAGALMLLGANFMMSGKLAWTPGGYGIAFSRILQDGIVARYLNDNCGREAAEALPLSPGASRDRRQVPVGQERVRPAGPLRGTWRGDAPHRAALRSPLTRATTCSRRPHQRQNS